MVVLLSKLLTMKQNLNTRLGKALKWVHDYNVEVYFATLKLTVVLTLYKTLSINIVHDMLHKFSPIYEINSNYNAILKPVLKLQMQYYLRLQLNDSFHAGLKTWQSVNWSI